MVRRIRFIYRKLFLGFRKSSGFFRYCSRRFRRHRIRMPSVEGHAVAHTIVETQLALGEPVVVATCARLRTEGLDRHDAIHAIGSVLAGHIHALLVGDQSEGEPNERYYEALGKLSASKWRAG